MVVATALVYPFMLGVIFLIERAIPARRSWLDSRLDSGHDDHPVLQDFGHTILTAVAVPKTHPDFTDFK